MRPIVRTSPERPSSASGPPTLPKEGTSLAAAGSRLASIRAELDPRFAAADLEPVRGAAGSVAAYEGTVAGRRVRVTCSVRSSVRYVTSGIGSRRFTGIPLEISVDTPLATRLVVGPPLRVSLAGADNVVVRAVVGAAEWQANRRDGLAKIDLRPLEGADALRVRAADPTWAAALLDPDVRRELEDLLPARDLGSLGPVGRWSLAVTPGTLRLSLTPEVATLVPENLVRWIERAVRLAEVAESLPAPRELAADFGPTSETPAPDGGPTAREDRRRVLARVLLAGGCLVSIPLVLMVAFGVGFLVFGERVMVLPIVFVAFFMPYAMWLLVRNKLRTLAWARRRATQPHWSRRSG